MGLLPYFQTKDQDLNKLQTVWMSLINPAFQSISNLLGVTTTQTSEISTLQGQVTTLQGQTALIPKMSDWVTYSLTIGATTTPPTKGTVVTDIARWRRVGDSLEMRYDYRQSAAGSAGSGTYLFPIPAGLTIDSSKITLTTTDVISVGFGHFSNATDGISSTTRHMDVFPYNSTNLALSTQIGASDTASLVSNAGSTSNLGVTVIVYSFWAKVPITGWTTYA